MNPLRFSLPWPPNTLSSNARHGHWGAGARAKKKYRDACYLAVLEQRVRKPSAPRLVIVYGFVPPDAASYDRDNLIGRMKAGLDGVARAWGINDSAFVFVGGEIIEGVVPARGAAEVRVEVSQHIRQWFIERGPDGLPSAMHL